jgi:hypothetical protein
VCTTGAATVSWTAMLDCAEIGPVLTWHTRARMRPTLTRLRELRVGGQPLHQWTRIWERPVRRLLHRVLLRCRRRRLCLPPSLRLHCYYRRRPRTPSRITQATPTASRICPPGSLCACACFECEIRDDELLGTPTLPVSHLQHRSLSDAISWFGLAGLYRELRDWWAPFLPSWADAPNSPKCKQLSRPSYRVPAGCGVTATTA